MKGMLLTIAIVGSAVVAGRGLYGTMTAPKSPATVSYYGDGHPKNSVIYVDGVKQGAGEQWYANGQKEAEGRYAADQREGPWTFWNADGSVDKERTGEYRTGRRIGELGAS
jgi:antitoxin component YwqK of YwqJK toxin-antitoxin module